MFCGVDEVVGTPIVRCVKFCVDMTNFICEFLEVFWFSRADLKANKPLCSTIYHGPEPNVFLFMHNSSSSKTSTFPYFLGISSDFAPAFFYPVNDRNMANFKNSLNPHKAISFQMQLYCLSFDMFRVAAVTYHVMAPALFAQISLLFIVESAFYSFFAPAFRAFKFFIHTLILHHISDFSKAKTRLSSSF